MALVYAVITLISGAIWIWLSPWGWVVTLALAPMVASTSLVLAGAFALITER